MAKKRSTRKETFTRWDAVDSLTSKEEIAAYLNAALAEGDAALFTAVLGDIAKAHGMLKLAADTGLTRQGLYKALSKQGNASFDTVIKATSALGYDIKFEPHAVEAA